MTNIVVYGWYGQENLGDELFKESFKFLFPDYNFTYVTFLTKDILEKNDVVFFGGGSFLYDSVKINNEDLPLLKSKKIFYIGVGVEKDIHPMHVDLMKSAKFIAVRSADQLDAVKQINNNAKFVPDIVYSLQSKVVSSKAKNKSILVIPNISVVPRWNDPQWSHSSWNHFKSEFAQFLDILVEDGYNINFFSMCNNRSLDDGSAASEIINMMSHRNNTCKIYNSPQDLASITQLLSQYQLIITQRFHGIVLSEMARVPYLAIHHHDKLKYSVPHEGKYISYYGTYKQELFDKFNDANNIKYCSAMPIDSNIFEELQQDVVELLKDG
jgi:polysaccharide pyruvyl transferase WcaK-like protein